MHQAISSKAAWGLLAATFLLSIGVLAVAYVQGLQLDVIYVPSPRETVDRMMEVGEVGPQDFVIDLGSGDGRIPIAAGRRGARALGVDLDPARIRDAQLNAERHGVADRVKFRQENLFETDLSEATVLTMYLLPSMNMKLRPTILALRPGTRVVTHDFRMGDWKPDLSTEWRVHFWVVPAPIAGRWQLRSGARTLTLEIEQTFQKFQGWINEDGRTLMLQATRLRGAEIEFSTGPKGQVERWLGSVDGNRMQGRTDAGAAWSATRL